MRAFLNAWGVIRTHGALAETLVLKIRWSPVITMDLIVLGETKKPKVDHFLFV